MGGYSEYPEKLCLWWCICFCHFCHFFWGPHPPPQLLSLVFDVWTLTLSRPWGRRCHHLIDSQGWNYLVYELFKTKRNIFREDSESRHFWDCSLLEFLGSIWKQSKFRNLMNGGGSICPHLPWSNEQPRLCGWRAASNKKIVGEGNFGYYLWNSSPTSFRTHHLPFCVSLLFLTCEHLAFSVRLWSLEGTLSPPALQSLGPLAGVSTSELGGAPNWELGDVCSLLDLPLTNGSTWSSRL